MRREGTGKSNSKTTNKTNKDKCSNKTNKTTNSKTNKDKTISYSIGPPPFLFHLLSPGHFHLKNLFQIFILVSSGSLIPATKVTLPFPSGLFLFSGAEWEGYREGENWEGEGESENWEGGVTEGESYREGVTEGESCGKDTETETEREATSSFYKGIQSTGSFFREGDGGRQSTGSSFKSLSSFPSRSFQSLSSFPSSLHSPSSSPTSPSQFAVVFITDGESPGLLNSLNKHPLNKHLVFCSSTNSLRSIELFQRMVGESGNGRGSDRGSGGGRDRESERGSDRGKERDRDRFAFYHEDPDSPSRLIQITSDGLRAVADDGSVGRSAGSVGHFGTFLRNSPSGTSLRNSPFGNPFACSTGHSSPHKHSLFTCFTGHSSPSPSSPSPHNHRNSPFLPYNDPFLLYRNHLPATFLERALKIYKAITGQRGRIVRRVSDEEM